MWGIEPISPALQAALNSHLATAAAAFQYSRSPADGQILDDITNFIEALCDFVQLSPINHPDNYLKKIYQPWMFAALTDYRVLSAFGWSGFFRLDHPPQILRLVYVKPHTGLPMTGIKVLLDSL